MDWAPPPDDSRLTGLVAWLVVHEWVHSFIREGGRLEKGRIAGRKEFML